MIAARPAMRTATELLIQYAAYHRDRRNIVSHFVGVPLIVFAIGVLLARPALPAGGIALTPAWVVFALAAAWYLTRGSAALGVAVSAAVAALLWLGQQAGAGSVSVWLGWGLGCFAVGWVIQCVGHGYEGRKPAFVDDLVGLLVGPMFVTAEAMFMLGWNKPLQSEIEQRVGPTTTRDMARIA
jgi:uncharacterized membrane protein YGL010W